MRKNNRWSEFEIIEPTTNKHDTASTYVVDEGAIHSMYTQC